MKREEIQGHIDALKSLLRDGEMVCITKPDAPGPVTLVPHDEFLDRADDPRGKCPRAAWNAIRHGSPGWNIVYYDLKYWIAKNHPGMYYPLVLCFHDLRDGTRDHGSEVALASMNEFFQHHGGNWDSE